MVDCSEAGMQIRTQTQMAECLTGRSEEGRRHRASSRADKPAV